MVCGGVDALGAVRAALRKGQLHPNWVYRDEGCVLSRNEGSLVGVPFVNFHVVLKMEDCMVLSMLL